VQIVLEKKRKQCAVRDLLATHLLCTGLTKTTVLRVESANSVGGKEKAARLTGHTFVVHWIDKDGRAESGGIGGRHVLR
jgi:hypothetical protein